MKNKQLNLDLYIPSSKPESKAEKNERECYEYNKACFDSKLSKLANIVNGDKLMTGKKFEPTSVKKAGAPLGNKNNQKTASERKAKSVPMRFKTSEVDVILQAAKEQGKKPSTFIRDLLFKK